MGTLLVLGHAEDLCCRLVADELTRESRDVLMLPELGLFPQLQLTWSPHEDVARGALVFQGRRVRFSEVDGILMRGYGVPVSPDDYATKDGQYVSAEWHALLAAWLQGMPCPVVNRVRPALWYKTHLNVPALRALAPALPLRLPRTLVTTRGDEARAFAQSLPHPVWYGPLTQPSRYAVRDAEELAKLLKLDGVLPFYLTERVDGQPMDAYVVGDEVVAVDARGMADDDAAAALRAACAEVGDALGLVFYRLSLVRAHDGAWYCYGLDRMPHLYECAAACQGRIAAALARVLVAGRVRA